MIDSVDFFETFDLHGVGSSSSEVCESSEPPHFLWVPPCFLFGWWPSRVDLHRAGQCLPFPESPPSSDSAGRHHPSEEKQAQLSEQALLHSPPPSFFRTSKQKTHLSVPGPPASDRRPVLCVDDCISLGFCGPAPRGEQTPLNKLLVEPDA
ncbi:unnamed protein product [Pleuronectes platessa]|uniref:Uncharacterized protein n=1 Tax=Pleuronectes platessa TaxID=8262 RepID=A0A9N7Z320_PLEPL|nr:unnamed protein product [Pleuronectes platessa]